MDAIAKKKMLKKAAKSKNPPAENSNQPNGEDPQKNQNVQKILEIVLY